MFDENLVAPVNRVKQEGWSHNKTAQGVSDKFIRSFL